jgi:hypothetical protein
MPSLIKFFLVEWTQIKEKVANKFMIKILVISSLYLLCGSTLVGIKLDFDEEKSPVHSAVVVVFMID